MALVVCPGAGRRGVLACPRVCGGQFCRVARACRVARVCLVVRVCLRTLGARVCRVVRVAWLGWCLMGRVGR